MKVQSKDGERLENKVERKEKIWKEKREVKVQSEDRERIENTVKRKRLVWFLYLMAYQHLWVI